MFNLKKINENLEFHMRELRRLRSLTLGFTGRSFTLLDLLYSLLNQWSASGLFRSIPFPSPPSFFFSFWWFLTLIKEMYIFSTETLPIKQTRSISFFLSFVAFSQPFLGFSSKAFCVVSLRYNLQQVYMYFRGSGKAAEMKREAARATMMQALWIEWKMELGFVYFFSLILWSLHIFSTTCLILLLSLSLSFFFDLLKSTWASVGVKTDTLCWLEAAQVEHMFFFSRFSWNFRGVFGNERAQPFQFREV